MKVLISGPFCCGKTSIIKKLYQEYGIPKLIDDTTRQMRPGETQGFPYHFIDREQFKHNISEGKYLEYINYNDNYYGVPRDTALGQLSWSLDVLSTSVPIYHREIQDCVSIYLSAPSNEELIQRAISRGDDISTIMFRIQDLQSEQPSNCDYVIASAPLDEIYKEVVNIINQSYKF